MKIQISHITNLWCPVKFGSEDGYNMVVVTQALEDITHNGISVKKGGTLKLNLNSKQTNRTSWISILREGNVLDVNLYQIGKTLSVDKYKTGMLIKEALEGKQAKDYQGE